MTDEEIRCYLILHGWNLGRKTDMFPSYILLRPDGTKAIFRNLQSAYIWQTNGKAWIND
jgi:hypothetical protein